MSKRAEQVAEQVGKKIQVIIPVESNGETFSITHAYEKKVREMGYNIGSMQRSAPRALADENKISSIAKWRNISSGEYHLIEGVVLCADNRDGDYAEIVIFEED